jgi:phage host-nuclease inhibitor protein Gam
LSASEALSYIEHQAKVLDMPSLYEAAARARDALEAAERRATEAELEITERAAYYHSRFATAQAGIEALTEALRPFAEAHKRRGAGEMTDTDSWTLNSHTGITYSELRQAARVLAEQQEGT